MPGCNQSTPTGSSTGMCRAGSVPSWRARFSCAPCRNRTAPDPEWSSSAPGRSPRSSRPYRRRRLWMARFPPAPARHRQKRPTQQCHMQCGLVTSSSSWLCPPDLTFSNSARLLARHAWSCRYSERVGVGLTGADAHRVFDRGDENLAVADLAGLGGVVDGVHHLVDLSVVDGDIEPHLGQEVHGVFRAAIDFRVALLAAVAFDLGNRHALHADRGERVADLFKLERFDDGNDQFHGNILCGGREREPQNFPRRPAPRWPTQDGARYRQSEQKLSG